MPDFFEGWAGEEEKKEKKEKRRREEGVVSKKTREFLHYRGGLDEN